MAEYQENKTIDQAKEALRQEVPQVETRTVHVTGIKDLDLLVEEMEKIDKIQAENKDKMYALDVIYNGKPSNPYFTICKFIQELNNNLKDN